MVLVKNVVISRKVIMVGPRCSSFVRAVLGYGMWGIIRDWGNILGIMGMGGAPSQGALYLF